MKKNPKKPKDYVLINTWRGGDNWDEIVFSKIDKRHLKKLKRALDAYCKYWDIKP